jgi:molecular chaperone Hsp33
MPTRSSLPPEPADALTRFVFEHLAVRGSCVTLGPASRALLACRAYPPAVARVLVELAACAALLASALKFDGRLVLQVSGDGPLKLLVVECNRMLALRATAQWSEPRVAALPADATLAQLAGGPGQGRCIIALDRDDAPSYHGIVALQHGSVANLIAHYLATSEQIDSRIALAHADGHVAGLLLQRMPTADAGDAAGWLRVAGAAVHADADPHAALATQAAADGSDANAVAAAALLEGVAVQQVLGARFPDDDLRLVASAAPHCACQCSVERVTRALLIAGRDEIEAALAERGEVDVTCEFCNRRYVFAPDEARALFAAPPEDA